MSKKKKMFLYVVGRVGVEPTTLERSGFWGRLQDLNSLLFLLPKTDLPNNLNHHSPPRLPIRYLPILLVGHLKSIPLFVCIFLNFWSFEWKTIFFAPFSYGVIRNSIHFSNFIKRGCSNESF